MPKKPSTTKRKPAAKPKTSTKAKTTAKKPAAKKPAVKKPAATKKPAAKKPAVKKPAATATKKPATPAKKPAATKKETIKKPVASKAAVIALKSSDATDPMHLDFVPYKLGKDEAYMNMEQRAHFRHLLLGWKQALMEQVDRTVSHLQDEPNNLADPNDRATQEEEFALELRARDRERRLISKIDKTLDQIKQSDYGYCEQCGEEIGIRRLEARPTANLCIDCKTLAEIKEKHYSS